MLIFVLTLMCLLTSLLNFGFGFEFNFDINFDAGDAVFVESTLTSTLAVTFSGITLFQKEEEWGLPLPPPDKHQNDISAKTNYRKNTHSSRL